MKPGSNTPCSCIAFLSVLAVVLASIVSQAQSSPADGATLFKAKCAICHGADSADKTPMGKKFNVCDLRSSEVQEKSDADFSHVIAQGKGKMPAFSRTLN